MVGSGSRLPFWSSCLLFIYLFSMNTNSESGHLWLNSNFMVKSFRFSSLIFFFVFLVNLFIYFWLCWVFVAVRGLSLAVVSGGYSSLWCEGFSLRWLLLLQSTDSRRVGLSSCCSWALECRLSSCGAQA